LKKAQLRFRQIHLDFHTSEHIESIGSNFDPDEFAETLVACACRYRREKVQM